MGVRLVFFTSVFTEEFQRDQRIITKEMYISNPHLWVNPSSFEIAECNSASFTSDAFAFPEHFGNYDRRRIIDFT